MVEGEPAVLGRRIEVDGVPLPTVMIGRELARKLLVERGDVLRLLSPRVSASPLGALPRSRRFVVGALYDSGMVEYDSALVFLSIDDARALLGIGPVATGVEARLHDPYEAPDAARELTASIGLPYQVESWTRAHRNVFEALQLEKTAYFLILLLIILVAAFTIVSSLYMVVMEKRRDIAVLKAMGATSRAVARIFLTNGFLIGFMGTALGSLFGYLACEGLARYQFVDLPEGVFYVSTLPVKIVAGNFALVAAASMLICLGACLFPAWKASRVIPVMCCAMNSSADSTPILEAVGLSRSFHDGERVIQVLDGLDLNVGAGASVAIVGESGTGKSTLLHLLGALDRPDGGSVRLNGQDIYALDDAELARCRNRLVAFVFQFHHLFGDFDACENVMMPLLIRGESKAAARTAAMQLLERVGLGDRTTHRPGALSGGEQQRVAVARALVGDPQLVLADEPTGNLDPDTADDVNRLLIEVQRERGCALVVATHSRMLASTLDRTLRMADGVLHAS